MTCTITTTFWKADTEDLDYKVDWNDWIIRGVEKELYPCKPDIFEKTYEEVK